VDAALSWVPLLLLIGVVHLVQGRAYASIMGGRFKWLPYVAAFAYTLFVPVGIGIWGYLATSAEMKQNPESSARFDTMVIAFFYGLFSLVLYPFLMLGCLRRVEKAAFVQTQWAGSALPVADWAGSVDSCHTLLGPLTSMRLNGLLSPMTILGLSGAWTPFTMSTAC